MEYFALGGKPFLSRFPPHIPGIFNPPTRLCEQDLHDSCAPRGVALPVALPTWAQPEARAQADSKATEASGVSAGGLATAASAATAATAATAAGFSAGGEFVASKLRPGTSLVEEPGSEYLEAARLAGLSPLPAIQAPEDVPETSPEVPIKAPVALHTGFDPSQVQQWDATRFEMIRKLQDATRNRGQVLLMRDASNSSLVAVKQMPSRWVRSCHTEFVIEHPSETEMPWQDVGCVKFLNSVNYDHACDLLGIYRDDVHTYVVTTFATEGDLFSWCETGVPPGRERELVVQPLARQIMQGVQQLHDLGIVHRDLSLENILMSKEQDDSLVIRIIDFSMASTSRRFRNCVRGKASYQAPELHTDQEYDAYLTDAFALGVTLYALLLKDYPWLSTRPGGCKCFEYVRKHGFRSYIAKRKVRNNTARVADLMSEPLIHLLEGLLAVDPAERLTLGETVWEKERRSVWDTSWMHTGPGPE